MSFSVGILYSAQSLLRFIQNTAVKSSEFADIFKEYQVASPRHMLSVAFQCGWITVDLNDCLQITKAGEEVAEPSSMEESLRIQIKHLIGVQRPSWSALLTYGRGEAIRYFPSEVKQCFKEAGLLDGGDPEIIKWWDTLAATARGFQDDAKLEVGRIGERLSIEYERQRVGKEPIYQAIESNLSGYDLLSYVGPESEEMLRIEVKAYNSDVKSIKFYVTQNEWNVAAGSDSYLFHLWMLHPKPRLYIMDVNQISNHIPTNRGKGEWESVLICLEERFLAPYESKSY
jgi:Domain of unknown function (DUF3883)